MKNIAIYTSKALEFLVVIILAAMSCLVFLNVVLRYGFNSSINVTEELSRYLFLWLVFLGAVLAFNENRHVGVTFLMNRLSSKQRQYVHLLTDAMMLFCCYLIIDGSLIQFQLNLVNFAPISGLPLGISFLASVIAGSMIGLLILSRFCFNIVQLIKGGQ